MKIHDKAYFILGNKRRLGYIVGINAKTIWVEVIIGCSDVITIKRHIVKHNVKCYEIVKSYGVKYYGT